MTAKKSRNGKTVLCTFYDTPDLILWLRWETKGLISEKGVFVMYIRKSVLYMITAVLGAVVLAVLCVLFCFAQTEVPSAVYAAGWFGCLGAMLAASDRISRS